MKLPHILLQLDPDPQPSVFDAVAAVDAGAEHLLRHGLVAPSQVQGLVHGLMFTRDPSNLRQSAVFVGGSDVSAGEDLLAAVKACFFGPFRCSVMMDSNGCNTTAAAAVLAASREVELSKSSALVLAGTGPVGQRVARLLAREQAEVRVGSRRLDRAETVCTALREKCPEGKFVPVSTLDARQTYDALTGAQVVIAAGAAGVELLHLDRLFAEAPEAASALRTAIDLNAVPPLGLGGVEVHHKSVDRHGVRCYGAIGVGGAKMKIHYAAIKALFSANDLVLDAEEIYAIGKGLS